MTNIPDLTHLIERAEIRLEQYELDVRMGGRPALRDAAAARLADLKALMAEASRGVAPSPLLRPLDERDDLGQGHTPGLDVEVAGLGIQAIQVDLNVPR